VSASPKKVLFIGLGILPLGIIVLTLGPLQSTALWQAFRCGYDLGINNASLTQEQISEYCNNNQILAIEKEEEAEEQKRNIFFDWYISTFNMAQDARQI
jgi:hypothetical protein